MDRLLEYGRRGGAVVAATLLLAARPAMGSPVASDWAEAALGPNVERPQQGGGVTLQDLLRLREIVGMGVSPDGRWVAFSVRQASLRTDGYETRWFVVGVDGASTPRPLAVDGGEPIRFRGAVGVEGASFEQDAPLWSPDSARFAFRRKTGERLELWVARPSSGEAVRVWQGSSQVRGFTWAADGSLLFTTGLNLRRFDEWLSEGNRRFLWDHSQPFWAARTSRPAPPDCAEGEHPGCDRASYVWRPDGSLLQAAAPGTTAPGPAAMSSHVSTSGPWAGAVVALRAEDRGDIPRRRLTVEAEEFLACPGDLCAGQFVSAYGWRSGGKGAWMVRRAGAAGSDDDRGPLDRGLVLTWRPGAARAVEVRRRPERLDQCQSAGRALVCLQSSATQPVRLVSIDLGSGALKVIADPNPVFASKALPRVATRILTDEAGDRGFAQLVYPLDHQPGRAYPLVVTTYGADGFLKGATGGEYPILPMATRGFFVLAVSKPNDLIGLRDLSVREATQLDRVDQRGVARLARCIDAEIDALAAEGLVDPKRVALTGLSWGAMTVHYALQRRTYAAAITSAGSADVSYLAQFPKGPPRDWEMETVGATELLPMDPGGYNLARAWSRQPERLTTPLLINAADGEAFMGFEGFAALWRAQRPLELRVYLDEGHVKFHPSAFAAIYETNLMWLSYWLAGERDPRPAFADQYARWDGLRAVRPVEHAR